MTRNELTRRFPNASPAFIAANLGGEAPSPKPKSVVRHESVGTKAGEGKDSNRVHVRVESFRRKLCDPDNLCPKYFIDCLRYAELIRDDRPQDIILEVSQHKVKSKAEERTEITISEKQ